VFNSSFLENQPTTIITSGLTLPLPGRLKPEGGAIIEGLPNAMPLVIPGPGAPGSPF
jgi:hypothetical protein